MSRRAGNAARAAVKTAAGAVIVTVIVWHVGGAPFLAGLRAVNLGSIVAALAITALTTICAAWRWVLVSRALGTELPLRQAALAYYRSQFLNATLPSGVLGDVHRAADQGRSIGDVGRAARAVAWERTAGQLVQAILAIVVLAALALPTLPAQVRSMIPIAAAVVAVVAVTLVLGDVRHGTRGGGWRRRNREPRGWSEDQDQDQGRSWSQDQSRSEGRDQCQGQGESRGLNPVRRGMAAAARPPRCPVPPGTWWRRALRWSRIWQVVRSDLRRLTARDIWPGVGVASLVAVIGYLSIFLIAAQLINPATPLISLVPLGMVVLLAAAVPFNVAGWGPREGVAAWAFAAAGLGAAQGVAIATVYGVLVICSCLPGAVVLLLSTRHRDRPTVHNAHQLEPETRSVDGRPARPLDGCAPVGGIPWPIRAAAHSEVAHG